MYSKDIDLLINLLSSLQGIGPRSARRIALQLIAKKNTLMMPLGKMITDVAQLIERCKNCGNYDSINPCSICNNEKRDKNIICIVEDVADLWALERAAVHKGKYHVLGGTLSAIDGVGPDDLGINSLIQRANEQEVDEIILALNATIDGQTTAYFITDQLKDCNVKVSRLAHGVPVGGELDYMDDGT